MEAELYRQTHITLTDLRVGAPHSFYLTAILRSWEYETGTTSMTTAEFERRYGSLGREEIERVVP